MSEWWSKAACRTVPGEVFFPEGRMDSVVREALVADAVAVCKDCPVRPACAVDALRLRAPHGIRAGVDLGENTNGRTLTDTKVQVLQHIAAGA